MKNKKRINYVGKVAKVRSGFDGYELPEGLPEGSTVRIVSFDIGHFEVEHEGQTYKISMTCVANLHQLWN
ncbi:MAG: hypothetical protein H7Y43_07665 [Akkermansiaceae bacterium]|nr:hypothetical protein [Verrucomicrobiales bacterium]